MTNYSISWSKASASGSQDNCVEVGLGSPDGAVLVRDSKDPHGPQLTFTAGEWAAFKDGMAKGEPGLG